MSLCPFFLCRMLLMTWIQCWQKVRWGEIIMWKNVNKNKENNLESIMVYCQLWPVLQITYKRWWVLRAPAQPFLCPQRSERGLSSSVTELWVTLHLSLHWHQLLTCTLEPSSGAASPWTQVWTWSASRQDTSLFHLPWVLAVLGDSSEFLLQSKVSISVEAESLSGWNPLLNCTLDNCLLAKYCIFLK